MKNYITLFLQGGISITGLLESVQEGELHDYISSGGYSGGNDWITLSPCFVLAGNPQKNGTIPLSAIPFPMGTDVKGAFVFRRETILGYAILPETTSKLIGEMLYPTERNKIIVPARDAVHEKKRIDDQVKKEGL